MDGSQNIAAKTVEFIKKVLIMVLTLEYCLAPKFVPTAGCNPWLIPHMGIKEKASVFMHIAMTIQLISLPYTKACL